MSASLDDIRWRRTQLVAHAAVQRGEVSAVLQHMAEPLCIVATAATCMRYVKAHPLISIAALVSIGMAIAFMVSRNHKIFRLVQPVLIRAFTIWRTYRSLGVWITRGRAAWSRIETTKPNSRRSISSSTR